MPKLSVTAVLTRRRTVLALGAMAAFLGAAALPASALASHSQIAIIQDGGDLYDANGSMQTFRMLGANTVRVVVPWAAIAPGATKTKKPNFNEKDPNAYPAANWIPYDNIVRAAKLYGLNVDFDVTGGAPRWAEAGSPAGKPQESLTFLAWKPKASDYGQFVQAVGTRYGGHFTPKGQSSALPGVKFWSLFNEPNFGYDLGPQATNGSRTPTAPSMYRGLVNAGWSALHASGHGKDKILIGEFAAEGFEFHAPTRSLPQGLPGNYGQTRPLLFVRELYCVDSSYHQLRGSAAKALSCPTTAAAARKFKSQNPGLFSASGVADHPYPQGESPVSRSGDKVDFARFPDLGNLQRAFKRATGAYGGGGKNYSIYNTEYGYITKPPKGRPYVSPSTAAYYINWAEYLSWKQSSIASTMQYLLRDPPPTAGTYSGFASGLEFYNGKPKADYDAYRLPFYMPRTSFSKNTGVEVWGDARPAPFLLKDGPQKVAIQLNKKTVSTVNVKGNGYFDLHVKFPSSGTARLVYLYPKTDPLLPVSALGTEVVSRSITIKVH